MDRDEASRDATFNRGPEIIAQQRSRWADRLLFRAVMGIAARFIRIGALNVAYRDQPEFRIGNPAESPIGTVQIASTRFLRRAFARAPDLAIGEGYMDGEWSLKTGDLVTLMGMLLQNERRLAQSLSARAFCVLRERVFNPHRRNDPATSRNNAHHHYDIGNDLYAAFLDEGMNYSCAFFDRPDQSLREAQLNKITTTIRRLDVQPGMTVLDIGCGWGELTRRIVADTNAGKVVGITLADQQHALACARVPHGQGNRLTYGVEDYRDHAARHPGAYDRVVSVGMFEHVGKRHFGEYCGAIRDLLQRGGKALVHSIIRPGRGWTSPWIDKYIFPGGYIPMLEELVHSGEAAGLHLVQAPFEHDSSNYAATLRHWRQRFVDAYPSLDHRKYDERFFRMWNFYLAGSEAAFAANGFKVAQVLFEKRAA